MRQQFKERAKRSARQEETSELDARTDDVLAKAHESAARARRLKRDAERLLARIEATS